jgi:hypothetical protein
MSDGGGSRAKSRSTGRAGTRASAGRSDKSRTTARGAAARSSGRAAVGRSAKSLGGARARGGGSGGGGTKVTIDHDEIRRWAEERGGRPACVRGTGGGSDIGVLRIDFPGYTGEDTLQPISWDDFFRKFEERRLALVYQDTTRGQKSNFNKLVSRDDPKVRKQLGGAATAGRGK